MGRSSLRSRAGQQTLNKLVAERQEAIESMNSELKSAFRRIEKMCHDTREANLRFYYNLGHLLLDVMTEPKYGTGAMAKLERALSTQRRTLRRARQFAENYTPDQLDALVALEHTETGYRLHWGHVSYLLSLNTPAQRQTWAERAVKNLWDPPTLHANMKARLGNRGVGGGRPHKLPQTVHMQIRQMLEVTRNFVKKRELWNGKDENVFTNILEGPPDEFEPIDMEALVSIQENLQHIAAESVIMGSQIADCITRVQRVFDERAKEAEAADKRETANRRKHRSIVLDGATEAPKENAGGRKRATAAT